jgi:hypothetical protein
MEKYLGLIRLTMELSLAAFLSLSSPFLSLSSFPFLSLPLVSPSFSSRFRENGLPLRLG